MKNFLGRYKKYILTGTILLYAIMAVLLFYYGELSITGTVFALLPAIAAGIWIMRNYKFTRKVFQCKIDGTTMDIVDIYPLKFWQEPRQRAIRHRYGISSIIPLDNKPHGELYLKGVSALIPLYFDTRSPEHALILGVAGGAIPRYLLTLYPECRATGVELSRETIEIMSPYFLNDLPADRFTLVNADAADFVAGSDENRRNMILFYAIFSPEATRLQRYIPKISSGIFQQFWPPVASLP